MAIYNMVAPDGWHCRVIVTEVATQKQRASGCIPLTGALASEGQVGFIQSQDPKRLWLHRAAIGSAYGKAKDIPCCF
uniref:Uncharacterized protein n=1 Tax=Hyaloperonospora arabidopsidis (strain Emoy2) TaxID=559515 RepID=M4BA27_HYAAE